MENAQFVLLSKPFFGTLFFVSLSRNLRCDYYLISTQHKLTDDFVFGALWPSCRDINQKLSQRLRHKIGYFIFDFLICRSNMGFHFKQQTANNEKIIHFVEFSMTTTPKLTLVSSHFFAFHSFLISSESSNRKRINNSADCRIIYGLLRHWRNLKPIYKAVEKYRVIIWSAEWWNLVNRSLNSLTGF